MKQGQRLKWNGREPPTIVLMHGKLYVTVNKMVNPKQATIFRHQK